MATDPPGPPAPEPTTSRRRAHRAQRAMIELQIHPKDIRKRVRYLFFSRRQLWTFAVLGGAYLLLLGLTLALAPGVIMDLLHSRERRALLAQRELLEERRDGFLDQLEAVGEKSRELRLSVDKVSLVYGLAEERDGASGGYPFAETPPPELRAAEPQSYGEALFLASREELEVVDTFLDEIQAFEASRQDLVRLTPSLSPLSEGSFVLTSPYGYRRNPFTKNRDFHGGLDLAAPTGTEIRSPADGRVLFAGRYSLQKSVGWWRYGNLVVLAHGDDFVTVYGHCDRVEVEAGQQVRQGEVIATVGSTGMSTSPHLHYEVRRLAEDGSLRPVDPRIYILDYRWRGEERLLVASRSAPAAKSFQPLPPLAGR